MAEYIADNGTTITEAMIDEWADQADRVFQDDPVTLTPVEGRPWETTSPMRPRTIRLPDALWDLVEAKARRHHMSVSEYARHALANDLAKA